MIYVRGFVTFAVGPSHTAFQNTQWGEKNGGRGGLKILLWGFWTYITPNYQNFSQPLSAPLLFVRLTKYLQCHWRVYNARVPTWLAKTLLLFLPRWVLLHNGGLEGCGLRAGLPNKALVACSRQERVFASLLPKKNLIFKSSFYIYCMYLCGCVCREGWGWDMHVFGEGSESWLKMRKSRNWSTRHCRKLRVWNFPLFLLVVHFFPFFFSCSALSVHFSLCSAVM